jgi:hypothetical protein
MDPKEIKKPISDYDIGFRGQLTVNLPITIIMIVTFFGLAEFTDFSLYRNVLISFVFGWISWGFLVKNWIKWAKKNDVSDERLLKIGKPGLLVWSIHTIETVTKKDKYPWI